jgi:thiamine biosynthesis lipoprotein ApbE
MNRFEMCQLAAKGVRATHKTGGRFEDTINEALDYLGAHKSDQKSMHPSQKSGDKSLKSAA